MAVGRSVQSFYKEGISGYLGIIIQSLTKCISLLSNYYDGENWKNAEKMKSIICILRSSVQSYIECLLCGIYYTRSTTYCVPFKPFSNTFRNYRYSFFSFYLRENWSWLTLPRSLW